MRRALDVGSRARGLLDQRRLPVPRDRVGDGRPDLGRRPLTGVLGLVSALLALGIVVVIAASVVVQGEINAQSITGAICVYLLLGMIFLFIYGAVAAFGDGAFFSQGTDGTRSLRLYFSYVTLATLGYGDYTPKSNFGHTLAVVEALFGQLYLVTVVALLVSRLGPARARGVAGDEPHCVPAPAREVELGRPCARGHRAAAGAAWAEGGEEDRALSARS